MRITEILSSQEQINLVRLIMNTTLNALGQNTQPANQSKSPVVQAVKANRKPTPKPPKISAPPPPKPFPKPKPLNGPPPRVPSSTPGAQPQRMPVPNKPGSRIGSQANERVLGKMPKSLQPLPTSVLSPINKKPTRREKQELQKENDLINFLKTAQATR